MIFIKLVYSSSDMLQTQGNIEGMEQQAVEKYKWNKKSRKTLTTRGKSPHLCWSGTKGFQKPKMKQN